MRLGNAGSASGWNVFACLPTNSDVAVPRPTPVPQQLKLLDTAVTPACPAAKTSALIDSIAACDDYCSRGAWSFASLDWSVAAGSDIFGWQTAMPLLSSKPQPQAWPTCPNHLFSEPAPCPGTNGTAENGKDGQDGQDGSSSGGGSGGSGGSGKCGLGSSVGGGAEAKPVAPPLVGLLLACS